MYSEDENCVSFPSSRNQMVDSVEEGEKSIVKFTVLNVSKNTSRIVIKKVLST